MAYLLFSEDNKLMITGKEVNDFSLLRGDVSHYESLGKVKEVSQDDLRSIVCLEKTATLVDGNVVLSDLDNGGWSQSQEEFEKVKNKSLARVNEVLEEGRLQQDNFSSLKTRMQTYKTDLENLDVSSITFPVTTSFHRWWYSNMSSEPFTLLYLHCK
jgi:hypothetical protein